MRIGAKCTWTPRNSKITSHITYSNKQIPNSIKNETLDKDKYHRNWDIPYTVTIGKGLIDEWDPTHNDWSCFTDGSKLDDKSGAGVCLYNREGNTTELGEKPKNATVFQAEIWAIKMAADWLNSNETKNSQIHFYVDNQSALRAVSSIHCNQITVRQARSALFTLGLRNSLTLEYIRAHVYDDDDKDAKGAHIGNAEADRIAKAATTLDQATTIPLAVQTAKGILKSQMRNTWSKEWTDYTEGRQSKYFLHGPDQKFKHILLYGKEVISRMIRFLTGHSFLRVHNNIVVYSTKDNVGLKRCRLCQDDDETAHHIITECPILMTHRLDIFKHRFLPQYFHDWSLHQIMLYLSLKQISDLEEEE